MKKKILYFTILNYSLENIKFLKKNFEVKIAKSPDYVKKEDLKKIDIVFAPLGYFFDKKKILQYKNLKVIISNTTSDSHIDVKFAKKKNIKIITLKGNELLKKITPTAEHTIGMIISITRNYLGAIDSVKKGFWERKYFGGKKMLSNSKVGIVGLGRLGLLVAKYLEGMGCSINYYDPNKNENYPNFKKCKTLDQLIKESDIISLHLHPLKNGKPLLNQKKLSYFNENKYLINSSRGELIDENFLFKMIKQNKIGGYATDVIHDEFNPSFKLKKNKIFQQMNKNPNKILIFPHIGGSTLDAWHQTQRYVLDKVLEYFDSTMKDNYKIKKNLVWALVTARGGSKSIPLKNIAKLNGKRLIQYTFDIIKKNKSLINKCFCSSDHLEIKKISIKNKIEYFERSKKLSGDNVSSQSVVKDFIKKIFNKMGYLPEFIFLFEPTSPFVRSCDIRNTIKLLKKNKLCDSSQTVTKVSSNSHAYNQRYHSLLNKKNNLFKSEFYLISKREKAINKQNKPKFFIHGNLRLFRTLSFIKYGNFFGNLSLPIEIPKIYAFDVDDRYDLEIAEALIKTKKVRPI